MVRIYENIFVIPTFFFSKDNDHQTEEEGEVVEPHPLVTVTDINPEDIPDVPVNKFLMRGGENKKDGDKRGDRKGFEFFFLF